MSTPRRFPGGRLGPAPQLPPPPPPPPPAPSCPRTHTAARTLARAPRNPARFSPTPRAWRCRRSGSLAAQGASTIRNLLAVSRGRRANPVSSYAGAQMFGVPPRTGPPAGETPPARARLVAALTLRPATSLCGGSAERERENGCPRGESESARHALAVPRGMP